MMARGSTVVLSPHLDDAVLSCWHVLAGPGAVEVINVFAGSPNSRPGPAWWDRVTGATDSAERMRERVAEDREALSSIERQPVNLPFLDEQYRDGEQDVDSIAAQIESRVEHAGHVHAPAALVKGHGDHALVRAAALDLRESGTRVSLYADLPHALEFGWPSWVTGEPRRLDPAPYWEWLLDGSGISRERLRPEIHELDPDERDRKLEAIRTYRTQLAALEIMFGGLDPERLRYEVTWEIEA
jgi:LmbE family N-acetylglucosaminyl deacetylase